MSDSLGRLLTPAEVGRLDGVGKTTVYRRLELGEYEAVYDGSRSVKILEASVIRRRASLPRVEYGARRGLRSVPPHRPKAEAERDAGT
jgi:hypothetical protein